MSKPKKRREGQYLGDDITIRKDDDGRVWLHRDPPGITTVMRMDALVLMELVAWIEDNMPEVLERVRTHTVVGPALGRTVDGPALAKEIIKGIPGEEEE